MDLDSFSKLVPRLLLPHAQEWAERAGHTQLSKILVDDKFRSLLEKVGEEFESRARSSNGRNTSGDDDARVSRRRTAPNSSQADQSVPAQASSDEELARLQERLSRLEREQEWQEKLLNIIREKVKPLAAALGSCTDCLVGVDGCPKCYGRGKVGSGESDLAALDDLIIKPLVARGVPLSLRAKNGSVSTGFMRKSTTNQKERGHVSSHDGQPGLGE